MQPTRSFKLRGMSHLVQTHLAQGQRQFVSSSGGNAGLSLAYACRKTGAIAHVVVPKTTQARMVAMIASEGATVEIYGESWQEAHQHAIKIAESQNAIYVPPFDNPLLWDGHSTMIDECAVSMAEPDLVVAAVGGGGLLCGIMEGMKRNNWTKTVFIAAETEGAASYQASIQAGKPIAINAIDTIATSLGAKQVAQKAWEWSEKRSIKSHVCTDAEAMMGVKALADAFNVIVEPACGAALSAVFLNSPTIADSNSILVIVCGGAGLDTTAFYHYLQKFDLI